MLRWAIFVNLYVIYIRLCVFALICLDNGSDMFPLTKNAMHSPTSYYSAPHRLCIGLVDQLAHQTRDSTAWVWLYTNC